MILVVERELAAASRLKAMIEFFDSPRVVTAQPDNWRCEIDRDFRSGRRLDAVFLGTDLEDAEINEVLEAVGQIDPNVSIVLMDEGGSS